jgi:hypothetical protein
MTNINNNIVTICGHTGYTDPSFNWKGLDSYGRFNPSDFCSMVRIYRDTPLSSITPAECDFIFNGLLRDTQLRNTHPNTWNNLANHLIATIQHLLCNPPVSVNDTSSFSYRLEYAKFMNERRRFRIPETESVIASYNQIIVKWRFPKS